MAETIGRAYVKILADGSGFPESVKDEVRAAEPALRKEARRQGDAYADEFGKRVSQKDIGKNIRENLERSMARTDIARAYFGSRDWDRFLGRLKKEAGDAGVLAGHELEVEFRHNIEGLADAVGDIGPRFDAAAKRLAEGAETARPAFDGLNLSLLDVIGNLGDLIDTEEDAEEEHDHHRRSLDNLRDALVRTSDSFDKIGDSVSRAFGKGSRNNFINFFGSLIGNISRLPGLLAGVGVKIIDFGGSIAKAFTDAPNAVEGFLAAAGKIAPAIGGAIIGFAALVTALGVVTSAFLLAAGAAAALVSTIAFGLVGAIAPLIGLLGPLGLAVGGVALAFIGMSDAAKESVKEAFEPLKDQLKALGDAARPGILDGITAAAENLEAPMKRLEPLFKVVGDSLGQFLDAASKFSFGPGFQFFVDTMMTSLPDTMRGLGTIFGQTFDGLMGLFANLQPVTDTFLGSLERISGAFADWAISPDTGTFFDHAAESASALLDFLGPVWELTQEILGAGRQTGDSLFKSMGDAISGWVDTLQANPDILKNFFDDARKMGEAIGNVIIQVGHLIDALDTPLHREWAIGLINAIGDLIGLLSTLIGWFDKLSGSMQALLLGAGVALTAFTKISGGAVSLVTNLSNVETRLSTLGSMAKFAAGGAGLGLFMDSVTRTEGTLGTLEGTIGLAATGFAAGGPLGLAIGATVGLFTGLWQESNKAKEALEAAADGAADSVGDWEGLADTLNEVTGATTEMTRSFIFDKLTKEGKDGADSLAESFNKLDVSTRTVIDAMMGSPEAIAQVEAALSTLDDQIATDETSLQVLQDRIANLNTSRAGGSERKSELEDERDALKETIEQEKNLRESVEAQSDALADSTQKVREKAAATKDWAHELRGFPKQIVTLFENENTLPKGIEDAKRLIRGYKDIQSVKKVRTLFEALGIEKSDKQIKRLLDRIKDTAKQKPRIPIEANAKPFEDTLANIKGKVADLPKKPGKAKFDGDTTKFDQKNQNVKDKLNDTGKKTATPKITVETTQAMTNIQNVQNGLNNLPADKYITIHVNTVRTGGKATASGGIFAGAQARLIGEAGPEAVVPLSRPLSMVDPAVRELSAIAQGMRLVGQQQRPVAQRVIDVGGIQIITPTKDPGAVAQEMVNRLVAVGY